MKNIKLKNCKQCNQEFSPKQRVSKSIWAKKLFCSRSCFRKSSKYSPFKKGRITWNKDKKGIFLNKKFLEDNPTRRGEEHWNWKGGITPKNIELRNSYEYCNWRRKVKNRDAWKCKISNSDCKGRLEVHHILRWADYPELRYDINNGITLCKFHHPRLLVDEQKLIPTFKDLIKL